MKRERRAVLKGIAALTGVAIGSGTAVGRSAGGGTRAANHGRVPVGGSATDEGRATDGTGPSDEAGPSNQQVNTSLPPGVTLFDLNDDGAYTATVESASEEVQDGNHPEPIHITSSGNSTVDYAASVAAPGTETTVGGLDELTYDYYEGPENANADGSSGVAPDQTFLVVENGDARHGMYLSYDAGGDRGQWETFDVLARIRGDTAGTSRWFEYTDIEEGYDGETFDSVVERFGEQATVVRVGVGHGNAVNPATLDVFYDNLVVNGTTSRFPTSVAKRVSNAPPN
jgi:hypothetical protein